MRLAAIAAAVLLGDDGQVAHDCGHTATWTCTVALTLSCTLWAACPTPSSSVGAASPARQRRPRALVAPG